MHFFSKKKKPLNLFVIVIFLPVTNDSMCEPNLNFGTRLFFFCYFFSCLPLNSYTVDVFWINVCDVFLFYFCICSGFRLKNVWVSEGLMQTFFLVLSRVKEIKKYLPFNFMYDVIMNSIIEINVVTSREKKTSCNWIKR